MSNKKSRKKTGKKAPRARKSPKVKVYATAAGIKLDGPVLSDEGEVYLSSGDLSNLRIASLEARNARNELHLANSHLLNLQRDYKQKLQTAQNNIKEAVETDQKKTGLMQDFSATMAEAYGLSDEDRSKLTYDEDTGRILICDTALVRKG